MNTDTDDPRAFLNQPDTAVVLDEGQRQAVLLALAVLCLQRPGWDYMLGEIVGKLHGREMWAEFMRLNKDRVVPL